MTVTGNPTQPASQDQQAGAVSMEALIADLERQIPILDLVCQQLGTLQMLIEVTGPADSDLRTGPLPRLADMATVHAHYADKVATLIKRVIPGGAQDPHWHRGVQILELDPPLQPRFIWTHCESDGQGGGDTLAEVEAQIDRHLDQPAPLAETQGAPHD